MVSSPRQPLITWRRCLACCGNHGDVVSMSRFAIHVQSSAPPRSGSVPFGPDIGTSLLEQPYSNQPGSVFVSPRRETCAVCLELPVRSFVLYKFMRSGQADESRAGQLGPFTSFGPLVEAIDQRQKRSPPNRSQPNQTKPNQTKPNQSTLDQSPQQKASSRQHYYSARHRAMFHAMSVQLCLCFLV
jgi:hypothetical protein